MACIHMHMQQNLATSNTMLAHRGIHISGLQPPNGLHADSSNHFPFCLQPTTGMFSSVEGADIVFKQQIKYAIAFRITLLQLNEQRLLASGKNRVKLWVNFQAQLLQAMEA